MRLPWVSRRAYEALERERNVLLGTMERMDLTIDRERQRMDSLVEQILGMKREGFAQAPSYPDLPAPSALPAEVEQALDKLGLFGTMRGQMESWAVRQLALGREARVVASELRAGGLAAPEEPSE
jgi:hypothetical protein